MQTISDVTMMQAWSARQRATGKSVALVPTMGFFHEGHLSLMRWARTQADLLIVSLFVNPTQFGPREDLRSYPRDMDRDSALAREAGVDVLFTPLAEDMFPSDHATWVEVPALTRGLCAVQRPTHFRGVATVVTKLFLLTSPDLAVFGAKDWQQLAVIRRLTRDLNIPVQIFGRPIVREPDGLAMSSRNINLEPHHRAQAPGIYRGLRQLEQWHRKGETDTTTLLADLTALYAREMPLAEMDYAAIVDPEQLVPLEEIRGPALVAVAVRFGKTRLIDNMLLNPSLNGG